MTNSTFVGNRAADCGGTVCWGLGGFALSNCILWGDIAPKGKEAALDLHSMLTVVSFSNVEGGRAQAYMSPDCNDCSLCWTQGNMDSDPCFADPGYWDTNGTPDDPADDFWVDGDYHLKSETGRWDPSLQMWVQDYVASPCIDAGDPRTSIGAEPFPQAGIVDMGAYGGTAEASKACFARSSCGVLIEGDLSGDCLINETDLAIMARNWHLTLGSPTAWCAAFVAGDMDYTTIPNRKIDFRDLFVMAEHWCEQN